jgi:hypothetical protein
MGPRDDTSDASSASVARPMRARQRIGKKAHDRLFRFFVAIAVVAVLAIAFTSTNLDFVRHSRSAGAHPESSAGSHAVPVGLRRSIGTAAMGRDGTIWLQLVPAPDQPDAEGELSRMPSPPPQEALGYGSIEINPRDPYYEKLIQHLGGLKVGETKPVLPWRPSETWHCAFDPERGPCPLIHPLHRF